MAIILCRTTLEIAPFDGISRFRFKGSSGKIRSSQPEAPLRSRSKLRTTSNVNGHGHQNRSTFGVQRLATLRRSQDSGTHFAPRAASVRPSLFAFFRTKTTIRGELNKIRIPG